MVVWICRGHMLIDDKGTDFVAFDKEFDMLFQAVLHRVRNAPRPGFVQHATQAIIWIARKTVKVIMSPMMTSSNGNIFRVTGPLCGEFTGPGEFPTQRPVTRSFDVFFDVRLNKRLSKQPRGWWFETQSWSLWRHCNAFLVLLLLTEVSKTNIAFRA